MAKFRTNAEYVAMTQALVAELMHKPKEELATQVAVELVTKLMQEEFDHDCEAELHSARSARQEAEERAHALYEVSIKNLTDALSSAPAQLAKRGAAGTARRWRNLKDGKFWFLDRQIDTSNTEILARRLDRYFGTRAGVPEPGEPASRGSSDTVREWKKLRKTSKPEETAQPISPDVPRRL